MTTDRHIVVSRTAPSKKVLWLKTDEWTVYGHTHLGWRPLQASLFRDLNSKIDAENARLVTEMETLAAALEWNDVE